MKSSDQIGPKLLELLGAPIDNCRSAEIHIAVGCSVFIKAEYYGSMKPDAETGEIETHLRKFKLVEQDG